MHLRSSHAETGTDPILLLSIPEVQRLTGLGRSNIYKLMDSGKIESVKIGKRRMIPYDALKTWLADLRREQN